MSSSVTREFPFIWEEITVPVPYRIDRDEAERLLLECVAAETARIDAASAPVKRALERRYFLTADDLTPRVFYRLTDNWLELTVRFIVQEHGIRDVKDAVSRAVLTAFDQAGIAIASATQEIVGMPPLRIELAPNQSGAAISSREVG